MSVEAFDTPGNGSWTCPARASVINDDMWWEEHEQRDNK